MFRRAGSVTALAALLILGSASNGSAQFTMARQQHETLDFELKSLQDNVTLYMGDPQELLLMNVRPQRTTRPRVVYEGQAHAMLRILDQEALDDMTSSSGATRRSGSKDIPHGQTWEIRLCPSGPTNFALQCEQGESSFDFTSFQVRRVDIHTDGTRLEVDFTRTNPIVLESFSVYANGGSLHFSGMINARAKEITLFVPKVVCQLEITGKAFHGESAMTFLGVPESMQLVVSRKVGVRVTGPATTTAHFAADHLAQDGADWVSRDYDKAKCRIRLAFSEEIPRFAVKWD